jgi:hypothetical protein
VYQPSREKVLKDRDMKAKAGQQGGWKSGESRRSNAIRSKRKAKPKQSASRLVEHPNLLPSKEGGEGRGAAATQATAPTPRNHAGCRRCDGHGWIPQPDGREAKCPAPLLNAEGTA